MPHLVFASPRVLPRADKLAGRVVVLDVAFAATVGTSVSFEQTTLPFIQGLGDRLTSPGGSVLLSRALPNATLKMFEGVGHNAHLELGEVFVETVNAFMRAAEEAPPG